MKEHRATKSVPSEPAGESAPARIGYYSAVLTAIFTFAALVLGLFAVPISGANCPSDCVNYPYVDTAAQYPRDFLWMPFAMLAVLCCLVLAVCIHRWTDPIRRTQSQVGLILMTISSAVLVVDYYLQFSVVPMSLRSSEFEGLALLIQYNPHGVFLSLEELGYILMSISFVFIGAALPRRSRLEKAARWTYFVGFALSALALVAFMVSYGVERQDRFEVTILAIDWLVLIANGIMLSLVFRRHIREQALDPVAGS